MGYYSTLELDVKVKIDKIEALKKAIADKKAQCTCNTVKSGGLCEIDDFPHYLFWDDFKVDSEGHLLWDEWTIKWYKDTELAIFLKDYFGAGDMVFVGENGERWGYRFDGDGNAYNLEFVTK